MNVIVPLRWCDSKIVVGTRSKCTGDNLPDEVRWFPSCFWLPLVVLVRVVGNLGEDELRGDADLDQVLHNFAKNSNTVHSLQIGSQLTPADLSILGIRVEWSDQLLFCWFLQLALCSLAHVRDVSVKFRDKLKPLHVVMILLGWCHWSP